jgi:predicted dehydrogenase
MTIPMLRVGVAGTGHFGRYHALKAAASPRTRLTAVFDPDLERAKTSASRNCWIWLTR